MRSTGLIIELQLISKDKNMRLCSPNDKVETGRDDELGLPLSGVDLWHAE